MSKEPYEKAVLNIRENFKGLVGDYKVELKNRSDGIIEKKGNEI